MWLALIGGCTGIIGWAVFALVVHIEYGTGAARILSVSLGAIMIVFMAVALVFLHDT